MRDEHYFIAGLCEKYPDLNQEEQEQLNRWLEQGDNKNLFDRILEKESLEEELQQLDQLKKEGERSWEKFRQSQLKKQQGKLFWLRNVRTYVVAASIIMILGIGGVIWYQWNKKNFGTAQKEIIPVQNATDAEPGQFKAKLILGDGSTVILDTSANGRLAQQGNVTVVNEDGKLVYKGQGEGQEREVLYNKLVTGKGETFVTVLSDGSKVWLNAESSISYPVTFTGQERKVTITGEAYFEVAVAFVQEGNKSVKQPFKVVVDNMEVDVLGTHFNVNAYGDEESIKTTLLEGKVRIESGSMSATLAPGQQAQLKRQAKLLQVMDNADVEQAVAWKNGFFQFSDDDLKTVMRQLERWYDVEVIYQGGVSGDTYGGRINRNSKASEVLTILERNGVHFKIQGKKIIVNP